jgi:predicted nucleic acid binding AN1-type Zn finger protein
MASRLFWRYLTSQEIKMCEMCGENFAVTEMLNPNYDYHELGESRKLKVCLDCSKWVADTQRQAFEREVATDA